MKNRILSILLALTMVLSLASTTSFAAPAGEPEVMSEDLYYTYPGRYHASSEHFSLEAHSEVMWQEGWVASCSPIVIESKSDTNVISAIEAVICWYGENYSYVRYSSGEMVETGSMADRSTVHVNNISANRLEIYCDSGTVQYSRITVYYTHDHHEFACDGVDNGDGTHTLKCTGCDEYGSPVSHSYRPVNKINDNPLTYTAKCKDCPNTIDSFVIDHPISFNYTDSTRYQDIEKGQILKGGTKLKAEYTLGDAKMVVYIDGQKAADIQAGEYWTASQCVKCLDYDTEWFTLDDTVLTVWFETVCEYTIATCELPSVCIYCGRTVADPVGHKWKSATCTEPKTCIRCAKTEGSPYDHSWTEATCTAPKTCSDCGLTEGDMLEHTYDIVDNGIKCTGCGKLFVPEVTETKISYIDRAWNSTDKTVDETEKEREEVVILDENTTVIGNDYWYVVNSAEVTNANRITVGGTANLIICDGCTLNANSGINVTEGNTLNIYAQSEGTGKLIANAPTESGAIGGNPQQQIGTINIFGGTVTASGAEFGAGIGGGYKGNGGNVTVYGGTVNATAGRLAAAIGGGAGGGGGYVTLNGGVVNATAVDHGAGIGSGTNNQGGTVIINGGVLNAKGGLFMPAIGGANNGPEVTVNGGNVTAIGGNNCKAIGVGYNGNDDGSISVANDLTVKGGANAATAVVIPNVGSEQYINIFYCEHAWDDGVITTPATYTTEGEKTYTCTLCGSTKTEILPKLGCAALFDMSLTPGKVAADTTPDKYQITWDLNVTFNNEINPGDYDFNVFEYGIKYAANEKDLADYMGGTTPIGTVVTREFASSSTGLSFVYKTTRYHLHKVAENRKRYAIGYIRYEIDGKSYETYTVIDCATTYFGGLIGGNGDPIDLDDGLQD